MRFVTVLLNVVRRAALAVALLAVAPAFADDRMAGVRVGNDFDAPMAFRYEDRPLGGPVIWAVGRIMENSAATFAGFLASHPAEVRPGVLVAFHSPGGDPDQGMAMGRMIRAHGLWTTIAQRVVGGELPGVSESGLCASACSLAFLGGVDRSVPDGSQYGVHDASHDTPAADDFAQGQLVAAQEASYITSMGAAAGLTELKNHYDSSKGGLLLMTPEQMAAYRVTTPEVETTWAVEQIADTFWLNGSSTTRLPGQLNQFRFQCVRDPTPRLVIAVDYVPADRRDGIAQTPATFAAAVTGFRLFAPRQEPLELAPADVLGTTQAYGVAHVAAFFRGTARLLTYLTEASRVRVELLVPHQYVAPADAFDVDLASGRDRIDRFVASCR